MSSIALSEVEIDLAYRLAQYGARPAFIRDLIGMKLISQATSIDIYQEATGLPTPRGRHAYSDQALFDSFDTWIDASTVLWAFEQRQDSEAHLADICCNVYEHHCTSHLSDKPLPFDLVISTIRSYISRRLWLTKCQDCGFHHLTSLRTRSCPWCLQAKPKARAIQKDLFDTRVKVRRMGVALKKRAVA